MPCSSAKRPKRLCDRYCRCDFGAFVGLFEKSSQPTQRTAAPNFELKDLSGNTVRLDSFKGHPVLLDFWATWCGPCRMSIPLVEEFYASHKSEGRLIVLGMNMDDDTSTGVYRVSLNILK